MAFKLVHARYDDKSKRAYVELCDADDDGGEMLASAAFSFRTKAKLSNREIEHDVIRKAKNLFHQAFIGMCNASEGKANEDHRESGKGWASDRPNYL
jgi:hypothetical protein